MGGGGGGVMSTAVCFRCDEFGGSSLTQFDSLLSSVTSGHVILAGILCRYDGDFISPKSKHVT